jgi:hypothetical protein
MTVPAKITERNKTSIGHGTGGNTQVWVGPVNRSYFGSSGVGVSREQEYYFPVYNPETKTTDYYVTQKNAFGRNRYIDKDGTFSTDDKPDENIPAVGGDEYRIGTRDADGNFVVNDNFAPPLLPASIKSIKEGFANNEDTQNNLEYSARYTVGDSLRRINGKTATPTQIQQYLPSVSTQSANQLVAATPSLTPQSGQPQTSQPDQPEIVGEIADLTIGDAIGQDFKSKSGVADLIYPERSNPSNTDYVKFTSLEYLPATASSTGFGFVVPEQTYTGGQTGDKTSVYLPIQGTIADSNGVGWNEETINAAQIAGAAIALNTLTGGVKSGLSAVNALLSKAQGQSEEVKNAIKAATTEAAIGANILPRVSRAIFNPNTELLFQGPQLRSFTFTFKLTPRNDSEAKIVKDIIKFFKKNMSAKTTSSELFLKAPNVFRIQYLHKNQTHDGINLIKDCALQSFNVDYTPDGSYMAYSDGSMFSYNLQLTFMELLPIYSKDYDSGLGSTHSIGF